MTATACRPVSNPDARQSFEGVFLAPDDLAAIEPQWRDLAAHAVEKNPFYMPFLLRPALAHLAAENVTVACVFDGQALIGLLPLAPARGYARLPVDYLASYMHEHCFYAAPLVRVGREPAFFATLFSMMENRRPRPAFLRLRHIDAKSALAAAAREAAKAAGRLSFQSGDYERALLCGEYSAEDYLEETVRKKKRKELGRLRRRLEERGEIRLHKLKDRDDVAIWTAMFLALESAGWKGSDGSAIASSPRATRFFREAVAGAFEAGALRFYRLDSGPDTIAMIVNFLMDGEGYSFKIAHDPAFARFSPGVMLEIEMLKALEAEGLRFVDSCARANHSMINSLWTGRRPIAGLNIGGARPIDHAVLAAARGLEAARAKVAGTTP